MTDVEKSHTTTFLGKLLKFILSHPMKTER